MANTGNTISQDSYIFADLQQTAALLPRISKRGFEMLATERYGRNIVFEILKTKLDSIGWKIGDFADNGFDICEPPQAMSIADLGLSIGQIVTLHINDEYGQRCCAYKITEIFDTGFAINHDSFFFGGQSRYYYVDGQFLPRTYLKMLEQQQKMPDLEIEVTSGDAEYVLLGDSTM